MAFLIKNKNKFLIRALVVGLEFLVLVIVAYLIFFPFWSAINYKYYYDENKMVNWQNSRIIGEKSHAVITGLDQTKNYLLIPKINVSVPIIEGENSDLALSRGAWRFPGGSTPDKGGNTVITGHRFKYLPPSNLTFYLLDKLEKGDYLAVFWEEKKYLYQVRGSRIIKPDDTSILEKKENPILTVYTCHPIFSQKERLVVVADLVEMEDFKIN